MSVETLRIPSCATLDGITVYWHNYDLGQGMVTIVCWGCAWTAYFGSMNGKTIQEFFAMADVGYLINKLGITQFLKQNNQHRGYLGRIVSAVKDAMKAEGRDG